jgi:regulator of protease activity HflC (stomatin/prohibitin superfamily)
MTILTWLLGSAAVIGYVVFKILKNSVTLAVVVRAFVGLAVTFVVAQIVGAIVVVPAGSRGVIFDKFTGVKAVSLQEGFNLVMPFVQDAIVFDVRVQKTDVKAGAASKDLQDVTTEVVLNFRPKAEMVPAIYKEYGLEYADKVVAPAVQEAVKAVIATYTAEEIITKREELKMKVKHQLADMISEANLTLVDAYMTNFAFSKGFSQAIEGKQVAQQNALTAQRDLERVRFESQQKVVRAEAEAESLRAQKMQITPELLQLRRIEAQTKAIEKWNGVLPVTMLGDTVPFVNVQK